MLPKGPGGYLTQIVSRMLGQGGYLTQIISRMLSTWMSDTDQQQDAGQGGYLTQIGSSWCFLFSKTRLIII